VSNTDQVLSFKKNPFKVLRGEIFEGAFTNEACAAMHAIYLQQTTKVIEVLLVERPDGTRVAARQYRMNGTGNRIEGVSV